MEQKVNCLSPPERTFGVLIKTQFKAHPNEILTPAPQLTTNISKRVLKFTLHTLSSEHIRECWQGKRTPQQQLQQNSLLFLSDMDLDLCRTTISRKKMGKDRRRFSDEQIRLLEFMFESESRPEPQMKHQLANRLGLQPRQVAIWFQNRRARLKTKQIEREYNILKANYDTPTSRFESLKKENQSLVSQMLRDLLGKTRGSTNLRFEQTRNSSNGECKREDMNSESKEKPGLLLERYNHNIDMFSDDVNSQNLDCFQEETDILNNVEHIDGC